MALAIFASSINQFMTMRSEFEYRLVFYKL